MAGASCIQHLEGLLDRYAEELARCPREHPDSYMGHPREHLDSYMGHPREPAFPTRQLTPTRHSAAWDHPFTGGTPVWAATGPSTMAEAPWATGFASSGHPLGPATDALLRKIAQACDRSGIDIRTAFQAFDANKNGFLSPQEFRDALSRLRIGASDEEISMLLSRLDTNAD